jgi:hypothetical protein
MPSCPAPRQPGRARVRVSGGFRGPGTARRAPSSCGTASRPPPSPRRLETAAQGAREGAQRTRGVASAPRIPPRPPLAQTRCKRASWRAGPAAAAGSPRRAAAPSPPCPRRRRWLCVPHSSLLLIFVINHPSHRSVPAFPPPPPRRAPRAAAAPAARWRAARANGCCRDLRERAPGAARSPRPGVDGAPRRRWPAAASRSRAEGGPSSPDGVPQRSGRVLHGGGGHDSLAARWPGFVGPGCSTRRICWTSAA